MAARRTVAAVADEPAHKESVTTSEQSDNQEDCELSGPFSHLQTVSVMFRNVEDKSANVMLCLSLFDTGSALSLIRKATLPSDFICGRLSETSFRGLSQTAIPSYGNIELEVSFKTRTEKLKLMIVPDYVIPFPMLLGRDFLDKFNIHLYQRPSAQTRCRCGLANKLKLDSLKRHTCLCTFDSSPFRRCAGVDDATVISSTESAGDLGLLGDRVGETNGVYASVLCSCFDDLELPSASAD